ncbi:uncharacterized protein F5147DRAFT_150625 [Suillus discolor]|uniref:Uncharacterized protein n=1 Tax=Suillus discolor TaxID=1912936 RepID=A0A9P7F7M0_9AGAM|nr:uncharacterized protein F5147DRAFT_150625 [Suillus discolor]KAG2109746.1 hypothetical protein F5147DRAFT_150625 [Suillus discolor]
MHHEWTSSLTRIPVIKVYGIYRHSELGRIWNALGNHLARRGAEYRRRCIFRTKPTNNIILPASFPPTEPQPEIPASPLDLGAKDMEHLHSLLVLEKYVTFSQAFLHISLQTTMYTTSSCSLFKNKRSSNALRHAMC